ncbi:uncharacterized protein LOC143363628 [Halictus rubicundus]|uniref:uncharacterized protein LOC143363628 n=1 Tax=Halictus rubicundus TaxID=77578 RepID=UPI0040358969
MAEPNVEEYDVNKVSIKIPPFWVDKPEIWFYQVEAQFQIGNITQEDTKFNYLIAQLEPKFIENLWDIIQDRGANKYTMAKQRLLNTFKESENKRIKKLITGMELGDMKPSQLLRRMRTLENTDDISEKVLKTLWLEKMPDHVKNVLVVSNETLDRVAEMADKMVEMTANTEIAGIDRSLECITKITIKKWEFRSKPNEEREQIKASVRSQRCFMDMKNCRSYGEIGVVESQHLQGNTIR